MKPAKPRRSLLSFLPLEDRTVPALVSWDGGGGNLLWATPANWSGDTLPGAADDVVIDTTFADKTISLGITTKVASLNSASNITVTSTGTLDVSGANPDVPAIAKNLIIEGTLRNTITSSGTPVSVRNNGVLDGVTIASGGTLRVGTNGSSGVVAIARNGLTLNGRLFLGDFYSSQIRFEGSQTLSGTGTVTMEGTNGFSAFNGLYADQTLTISEGITINGTNGFVGNTGSTTINRGIIRASGGGTISLSGDHPLSSGLLDTASDGRLTLTGTLAGSGVVNIGDNATLTVGSTGVLKGVTVNKKIHVSQGSVLDGVTITSGGTLRVGTNGSSGVVAIARNGLTLNGRLFLGDFYSSQIRFEGSQTLSGTGTVTMEGTNGFSAFNGLYADQTLTISEGITINGTNGFVGTQSGTTVNNGLIHASAEGGTITTFGTFTNNGELRATGGTIDARNLTNLDSNGVLTGGRYTFNANGRLRVARGITSIDSTFTLADPTASVVAGSGTTEALTELTGITAAGQFTLTGGRYCTFIALECGPVGAGVRQCGDTHRGVQQHRAIHHAGQWGSEAGAFGKLTASGAATLAGVLEAQPVGTGFQLNDSYTVLSANKGRTGQFATTEVAGNTVSYTDTTVVLGIRTDVGGGGGDGAGGGGGDGGDGGGGGGDGGDGAGGGGGGGGDGGGGGGDPPPPPPPRSPFLVGTKRLAVGSSSGAVSVFDNAKRRVSQFSPFGVAFTGEVRVATADFNGDGVVDTVAGTGPGTTALVRIIDGATESVLFEVNPFDGFTGGVFVAVGDLNNDGKPDFVITPDEGGGPRARIFSGNGFVQLVDFFGIDDDTFRGGARASMGDINGDGFAELVVSAGFGGGPRVTIWDGFQLLTAGSRGATLANFFAFESALRNGCYVTVGDITGDARADLVFGAGPGGGPRVRVFDGPGFLANSNFASIDDIPAQQLANFFGGDSSNRGGIRVAIKDLDDDIYGDLVVGSATGNLTTGYPGSRLRLGDTTSPVELALEESSQGIYVG